ncbi:MAG TPA: MotA/TolQ/ExbB proton channel family protein [Burkholderiales bacterium]|nr:MotA/TolQ/ExbB proton channel family protein [Burkholderiales bacterium]
MAAFLSQSDAVGRSALCVLLLMSLATWYLIVSKAIRAIIVGRQGARFLDRFWSAPDLRAATAELGKSEAVDAFSELAAQAMRAANHHAKHGAQRLDEAGSAHEFLTRAMRSAIAEHILRAESGLMVLASVGATAPFVGLFGTVWGVYNALVNIGMTGQGTLDKVAGPVGEALIMTALGLVVAIPAVLAYNGFTRRNRLLSAKLDAFAHDLFALLTTGASLKDGVR